jgi:hypothetical protein
VEYPKDKVLLYLTDAFGLALSNNLVRVHSHSLVRDPGLMHQQSFWLTILLAMDLRHVLTFMDPEGIDNQTGLQTIVPDMFNDDPVPQEAFSPNVRARLLSP